MASKVPAIHWRRSFQPAPSSARAARRFVDGALADAGFRGDLDTVLLLVSEVVSNAVRHAGTPFHLHLELEGDEVTVTVADASSQAAQVKDPGPTATSGRGMFIVEQLANRWGMKATPDGGKAVWFSCT
jgi:anti-sigma regulatory factor (Ser/Thr protein kinase)